MAVLSRLYLGPTAPRLGPASFSLLGRCRRQPHGNELADRLHRGRRRVAERHADPIAILVLNPRAGVDHSTSRERKQQVAVRSRRELRIGEKQATGSRQRNDRSHPTLVRSSTAGRKSRASAGRMPRSILERRLDQRIDRFEGRGTGDLPHHSRVSPHPRSTASENDDRGTRQTVFDRQFVEVSIVDYTQVRIPAFVRKAAAGRCRDYAIAEVLKGRPRPRGERVGRGVGSDDLGAVAR